MNAIKTLTTKEWLLWSFSVLTIVIANVMIGQIDFLTLITSLIGVTSLIFAAKGNVIAQILIIVFSILYGIISWQCHYWSEMITYLGMTMPMAIWATITWAKNPSEGGKSVAIQKLKAKHVLILIVSTIIVTIMFYQILKYFATPNLLVSTASITTSFLAAALTILRSSYYAFWYGANDLVLIVLWIMASVNNPVYIPVVFNFAIFFLNDIYGFISWRKRESVQN